MWIAMCERVDSLGTAPELSCFCCESMDNYVPRVPLVADKDIRTPGIRNIYSQFLIGLSFCCKFQSCSCQFNSMKAKTS